MLTYVAQNPPHRELDICSVCCSGNCGRTLHGFTQDGRSLKLQRLLYFSRRSVTLLRNKRILHRLPLLINDS